MPPTRQAGPRTRTKRGENTALDTVPQRQARLGAGHGVPRRASRAGRRLFRSDDSGCRTLCGHTRRGRANRACARANSDEPDRRHAYIARPEFTARPAPRYRSRLARPRGLADGPGGDRRCGRCQYREPLRLADRRHRRARHDAAPPTVRRTLDARCERSPGRQRRATRSPRPRRRRPAQQPPPRARPAWSPARNRWSCSRRLLARFIHSRA
jgi:hypothetical protein